MATRNIVPRADGEGSLGTSAKKWGNIYADNGHIAGRNIATDGATLDSHTTQIEQIRASVGTPLVANSVLDMTDINKIYVYTGNEQGYTKGDWYYYDGSAWVSGGVYNSTAFETDKTLTIEGAAADAKAAGDWLRDIAVPVTALPEIPETAFADEYMKVVVDKDNRVLYGVKRDGTFTWQKGVPQHVIEACNPTISNNEFAYVMVDGQNRILFGVKKDGSVTWQKGVPQPVKDAIIPIIENNEYLYVMLDDKNHVLYGVKKDGSFVWQKGIPTHVLNYIDAKNPLFGKRWCAFGDSITNTYQVKEYHEFIAAETGVFVLNYGVGGSGYYKRYDEHLSFLDRIQTIVPDEFDFLTIEGSINDYGMTLGDVTDTVDTTVLGRVNLTIEAYYDIASSKPIGLITPMRTAGSTPNYLNNPIENIVNGIVEIGRRNSIPVLDLYHEGGMRTWDADFRERFFRNGDGQHPTSYAARVFLAPKIREFILKLAQGGVE
jgi:hypothetical protein